MNKLPRDKQIQAITALVEGNSIRSTERMVGIHRDTVMRLMVRVGNACEGILESTMQGVRCGHVQVDELWAYVGKKQRRLSASDDPTKCGDFWTFVALDTETKVIPAYRVGKRDGETTRAFISDLRSKVEGRIQISSDMMEAYVDAVQEAFGFDVDYGRIVKHYKAEAVGPGRYSPPYVTGVTTDTVFGKPRGICTSHVERQNLTVRMQMRRFTRLTNGFSKRVENLRAAVSLHFAYYNLVRVHGSLRVTPAMAAGVSNRLWAVGELVELAGQ